MTCEDIDAFAEVKLCGDCRMEFSGTACMDLIGIDLETMAECEDTRQQTERAIPVWI